MDEDIKVIQILTGRQAVDLAMAGYLYFDDIRYYRIAKFQSPADARKNCDPADMIVAAKMMYYILSTKPKTDEKNS